MTDTEDHARIQDALRLLDEAIAEGGNGIPWVNAITIRDALTGNLHPAIRADLDRAARRQRIENLSNVRPDGLPVYGPYGSTPFRG